MITVLQFLLIAALLWAVPTRARSHPGSLPDHWLTQTGSIRAGILLLSALLIAGWAAFVGELVTCAALAVWCLSGDLGRLLRTQLELRSHLIASIAALRPAKGSYVRYVQLALVTLLLPALDETAKRAGVGITRHDVASEETEARP